MNLLVIGSGLMGGALAFDLARSKNVERITLADLDLERARKTAAHIGSDRVKAIPLNVEYYDEVISAMAGHDCAIGAASYRYNYSISKAAIETGVHYCDLGGNDDVVERQRTLHSTAREQGVLIVPNCGLAPGMANVLAAGGAKQFDKVDTMRVRVGGLPQHPKPPLNYQLVFSVEGLINEYSGQSVVLRDYKRAHVDTMTEIESIEFPPPFGTLEAFQTSGGTSLLPEMFEGKIRELDYKTIRYRGHCERFKQLLDLGFASSEPITVGSNVMTAKEMFFELLKRKLSGNDTDVVLVRASLEGIKDGRKQTLRYTLIDYFDTNNNITAMMRTTAFPTSIIAQMIVRNEIRDRGVLTPEQCVPLRPFLQELKERGINTTEEWN